MEQAVWNQGLNTDKIAYKLAHGFQVIGKWEMSREKDDTNAASKEL